MLDAPASSRSFSPPSVGLTIASTEPSPALSYQSSDQRPSGRPPGAGGCTNSPSFPITCSRPVTLLLSPSSRSRKM